MWLTTGACRLTPAAGSSPTIPRLALRVLGNALGELKRLLWGAISVAHGKSRLVLTLLHKNEIERHLAGTSRRPKLMINGGIERSLHFAQLIWPKGRVTHVEDARNGHGHGLLPVPAPAPAILLRGFETLATASPASASRQPARRSCVICARALADRCRAGAYSGKRA